MKLKGKLFLSFGVVMFLALSVLGTIILYSFSENIKVAGEENIRLQTTILAASARETLHEPMENIFHTLLPCLSQSPQSYASCSAQLEKKIEKIKNKSPYIDAVYLFSNNLSMPHLAVGATPDERLLSRVEEHDADYLTPQLISLSSRMYLVRKIDFSSEAYYFFIVEVNTTALIQRFEDLFTVNDSLLVLVDRSGRSILIIDRLPDQSITALERARIISTENTPPVLPDFNGYFYQYDKGFLGNRLFVVVDNAFFLKSLGALKNRIIAGILIVSWVVVWVILIVSHKISSPIRNLSKLTHEIAAFNYETELHANSKDEIGELTESFESMRRKIKGLIAKDSLTNLYNRRFLMHIFELAVLKAIRLEQNLSCIMMDLDFFKNINDNYGHQGGDVVLVTIGEVLRESTRDYDTPARFGGEEFILVLPDTDINDAYTIAERIRRKVEELHIEYNGKIMPCTMSLGVASLTPEDIADPVEKIINNADSALYQAKERGRNCTVVFGRS